MFLLSINIDFVGFVALLYISVIIVTHVVGFVGLLYISCINNKGIR